MLYLRSVSCYKRESSYRVSLLTQGAFLSVLNCFFPLSCLLLLYDCSVIAELGDLHVNKTLNSRRISELNVE